jgi:hypothetical protein
LLEELLIEELRELELELRELELELAHTKSSKKPASLPNEVELSFEYVHLATCPGVKV